MTNPRQTSSAHTPAPWFYEEFTDDIDGSQPFLIRDDDHNNVVATIDKFDPNTLEQCEGNARRIVHCVNTYDYLLAACQNLTAAATTETCTHCFQDLDCYIRDCEKAIAKARCE